MRFICLLLILLSLVGAAFGRADQTDQRTRRVVPASVRPDPPERARETLQPLGTPAVVRPTVDRPGLLEPAFELEGLGRGVVACFQLQIEQAESWRLVVREVDGPVAQIFAGEGPPPSRIPWDGRLLDGGLAWCGMTYAYDLAFTDTSGHVDHMAGAAFTLPAYSREEPTGISYLIAGRQLGFSGRSSDRSATVATLQRIAGGLNQTGDESAIRVEVLARDEDAAMTMAVTIRAVLEELIEPAGRVVEAYAGAAEAAPVGGTALISTIR